jgi:signal transduction histidine kinase/CheY-like chemotaxis protein
VALSKEVIHSIGTADEAITPAQDPALAALFGLLTANGRDEPIETSIERVLRATPGVADVGLTGPCDGATHALQLATARDEYGVLTLRVDDGAAFAGYAPLLAPIAARLALERELRELARRDAQRTEMLMRAEIDASPFGMLVVDNRTDAILDFNRRFCEIWGLFALEGRMRRGELTHSDLVLHCAPVLHDPEAFARGLVPLQDELNQVVVDDEIAFVGGRTIRRYSAQIRDGADQYVGRLYKFEDITERRRLEERVALSERMVAVGTLAAGVAHEINNPLTYVLMSLDGLDQELGYAAETPDVLELGDRMKPLIADARDGAERVRRIIQDLRVLSHAERPDDDSCAIDPVITSAVNLTRGEHRSRARIVTELAATPRVKGSAGRLVQVLVNLLVNAAQAIPAGREGATIHVRTEVAEDGHVLVRVRDTGAGIAPELLPRVFDPFFTTKPVGIGMGLGLSISHSLVTSLGGTIRVESELGVGTTFIVSLPPAGPPPGAGPGGRPLRAEVLIVDDEPTICRSMARALADYEVTTAASAGAALDLLAAGRRFDLVLCDITMPQIGGFELHARVRTRDHDQAERFVFVTGGSLTSASGAALQRLDLPVLLKPFSSPALREQVRRWLGRWPVGFAARRP